MNLTTILISAIILLAGFIFLLFRIQKGLKEKIEEKNSIIAAMRYNNNELKKELQRLQLIDEKKEVELEKINNTNNADIANMLNDKLSNSGG